MPEDWNKVASEAAAAISDVGFVVTLEVSGAKTGPDWRPQVAPATNIDVKAVEIMVKSRDAAGQLTGRTVRNLMIGAVALAPSKGDRVLVRGMWHEIAIVKETAPGGVALYYELELVE